MADADAAIRGQAAAEEFNARCSAVDAAGSKAFGEGWIKAKADLGMLGDYGGIPDVLVHAALETDDPAQALVELSKDLDSASDLIDMPAIKRGIAVGRLVKPKGASAPVSAAPPPPPARKVADDAPRDSDSDEEWNRKEELRERRLLEARRVGR